jgi:hypothetical protein
LRAVLDHERGAEYRAPTWSWASADGRAIFDLLFSVGEKASRDSWHSLLSVDEVSIEFEEPRNPYGQVRSAEISISGFLLENLVLDTVLEEDLVGLCVLEEGRSEPMLHGILLSHINSNTYQRKGYFWSNEIPDGSRFPIEELEKNHQMI